MILEITGLTTRGVPGLRMGEHDAERSVRQQDSCEYKIRSLGQPSHAIVCILISTYFDSDEGFLIPKWLVLRALSIPSRSYFVFHRCRLAKLNGSGTTSLTLLPVLPLFPSPSLLSS
uniref:Uncharacterized protein n=1 Tax=Megaselia scalaris TaxID=36166 RepID=T1GKK4_MEGSC